MPFQRLRRIHQLAFTHLVYPGAEHNRFAHSLGVLQLATRVFDHVIPLQPNASLADKGQHAQLRQLLRLYALLHDVGHGPFSHAGDGLFPGTTDHEEYSRLIVERTDIANIINDIGGSLSQEYGDEFGISPGLLGSIISGTVAEPRYHLLHQIMSSEVDVDKMDYLLRDSYNCGVHYGRYDLDRLLLCLQVSEVQGTARLGITHGGLNALEAFVLARYWMFLQVYFHRTRRVFDVFLYNFVRTLLPNGYPEEISEFLGWDDYRLWRAIEEHSTRNPWAQAIINREIWTMVLESPAHAEERDEVEFRLLQRELNRSFRADEYFIDRASKVPHKLPAVFDVEDEKAILLFKGGRPVDIAQESEIIKRIVSPIKKYRVYARVDKAEAVEAVCEEFHRQATAG